MDVEVHPYYVGEHSWLDQSWQFGKWQLKFEPAWNMIASDIRMFGHLLHGP